MPAASTPTAVYPAWEDGVIGQAASCGTGRDGPGWALWASTEIEDAADELTGAQVDTAAAASLAEQSSADMQRRFARGEHNGAFQIGRSALALWHQLGQPQRSCDVLLTLASACLEHEQALEALALVRHAFVLARTRVLPPSLVQTLTLMATLHGRMNDTATGEALALQSLSRARELHDPPAVLCALNGLLVVLLQAQALHREQGDEARAAAASQRLLRHAHQALAQSPFVPSEFCDLTLRIHAGAALLACDQATEGLRVLRGCMEAARRQQARVAGLWARYYSAQGTLKRGDRDAAAQTAQLLVVQLHNDDPPRLRMAVVGLQAALAQTRGETQTAHHHRTQLRALQEAQARQVVTMQKTLLRSADDVLGALAVLDHEWMERGMKPSPPL